MFKKLALMSTIIGLSAYLYFLQLAKNYPPFIIMDLKGTTLSEREKWMLKHPLIAGVILGRSPAYQIKDSTPKRYRPEELKALIDEIKSIRPDLEIMIDYEGGPIQRIEPGEHVPSILLLPDELAKHTTVAAKEEAAFNQGVTTGKVLKYFGIDTILGPVVDLKGQGEGPYPVAYRAISSNPGEVIQYTRKYMQGVSSVFKDIVFVLKHYPGLGHATTDTHHQKTTVDQSLQELKRNIAPFDTLLAEFPKVGVMFSHAIYPQVCPLHQATKSAVWHNILKARHGSVPTYTDDTSMKGFSEATEGLLPVLQRTYDAGNKRVLCMHKQDELYEALRQTPRPDISCA